MQGRVPGEGVTFVLKGTRRNESYKAKLGEICLLLYFVNEI